MHVTAIHISPNYGDPTISVQEAIAVAGQGLEGDRYFGKTRQVTLVATGELAKAAAELGVDVIEDGATRRNITVVADALPRQHGSVIQVGEVQLKVWRDCTPCEVMETAVGPGAKLALKDRAGVSATVVTGGRIRPGDPVLFDPS
jgi:MOSC domain-containing protein YiiM